MINLFEHYDRASDDFLRSQYIARVAVPAVAIYDDGFLPDEVDSPVQYFCDFRSQGSPLYFDKVIFPHFWRIDANNQGAQVFDLNHKRAEIVYAQMDNSRPVKEVKWLAEDSEIVWIDHYNRYGDFFAKTYYEQNRPIYKKYFNRQHQVVLTRNLISGDIFCCSRGIDKHFPNVQSFVYFYLKLRHYDLDHIIYNTLNQSLMVSNLVKEPGTDIMVWHEQTGDQIPGNMQFLINEQTRTKYVLFQIHSDWERRTELLPKDTGNVNFGYLGIIYQHPRANHLRPKALILTDSDQVSSLTKIVKYLPNIEFNIAARTNMSNKLMAYQQYNNVNLYPVVSEIRLQQLLSECDIYLDINQGREVDDVIRKAFLQNMLLVGFNNTVHSRQFIAPENIFDVGNVKQLCERLFKALVKPQLMKQLIDRQRETANESTIADYQKVFGVIK